MAQVQIEVGGRLYEMACRDGEEERLRSLGRLVDTKLNDIAKTVGRGHEARELLMTALVLADELEDARATAHAARQNEAQRITAIERCAERLEELAIRLSLPGDPGVENEGQAS